MVQEVQKVSKEILFSEGSKEPKGKSSESPSEVSLEDQEATTAKRPKDHLYEKVIPSGIKPH